MKNKKNILCTGLNLKEFKKQVKEIEAGKEIKRTCYVCHKKEGDIAISINLDGKNNDEKCIFYEVKLITIRRTVKNINFTFDVCFESAVLLGLFEEKEESLLASHIINSN